MVTEWRPKTVATRSPIAGEHQEWSLFIDFTSEVPLLLTLVLRNADRLVYGRLHRANAQGDPSVRLTCFPHSWYDSDVVRVSLYQSGLTASAGVDLGVSDERLKADPRAVLMQEQPTEPLLTGSVCRVAASTRLGISAEVIVLAKADTENVRGRWRVRRRLGGALGDGPYAFMLGGRTTGEAGLGRASGATT
jgi:hypothetical protein